MERVKASQRVIKLGDRPVHERTNPDYVDKHIAQLAEDVRNCPDEWLSTFIGGLPRWDIQRLEEMGVIEHQPRKKKLP